MRIVYHLGAHCTDEERLIRCLLKNRALLAAQDIAVPPPTRYRKLLRDTAVQLKGAAATVETQTMILEEILDEDVPDRLILSWDSFLSFPQWALRGALYSYAGERIRAFTQIFPGIKAEFHLAIRNPATFLSALFALQKGKSYDEFMEGADPLLLRWSSVVDQIIAQNNDAPLTIWCDEDTPLIWPEVLQAVSGHEPGTVLQDADELLSILMSPDGFSRLKAELASHPPADEAERRRTVSEFLQRHALPYRVEAEVDLPGWTDELVAAVTERYYEDVARIRARPGIRFLGA
ncbi:MAG: hypothetical protein HC844_20630 [Tabrizicola sp.]|nr:hypothetical protein [Tabrizicola sp.]